MARLLRLAPFSTRLGVTSGDTEGSAKSKSKRSTEGDSEGSTQGSTQGSSWRPKTGHTHTRWRSLEEWSCSPQGFFLLEVKGKSGETNASYWANKAKRDYLWTESDIFQKAVEWEVRPGQKRQRIGGKPEWVAKRRVLEQMYMDWCGAGSL